MTTTLSDMTAKKKPELSAEEIAAKELVRQANPAALLRLSTYVLIESHDEWRVADRRYLSEESMAQLTPPAPTAINAATKRSRPAGTSRWFSRCSDTPRRA